MAEKVALQATDVFSLGANFKAQSTSNPDLQQTVNRGADADGHYVTSDESDSRNAYSCSYLYVGTDLGTDLVAKVGEVVNSIMIDTITISLGAQAQVRVDVAGHQHSDNPHVAAVSGEFDGYDLDLTGADVLGATVQGAWDISATAGFNNSNADADLIGVTLTFSSTVYDGVGRDGNHWTGANRLGIVTKTEEWIGVPVLSTTGWQVESKASTDSNADFDKQTVSASKALTATTA